jgi:hypothetical protein
MGNSAFSQPVAPQGASPQPGEPGFIGPLLPENPLPGQPSFIGPLQNLNPPRQRVQPYMIQIPPQGGFAGGLAIIPPNGEPGIIIQAADGPGGPAPGPVGPARGPGVPALPVNSVAPVLAPIVPAPLDPLAGI